jgi:GNAT superfamily N-acetyltransferase
VHFGLYQKEQLIGIISIFKEKNNLFQEKNQFQIRGMAVLEEFQGKGFGAELVKVAENYCINQNVDLIWFNAREKAIPFYKKLGYTSIGDSFLIPDVGIHFAMYKKIHKNIIR